MSSQIITIVNNALKLIGEIPMSTAEFDSGTLALHTQVNEYTQMILFEMYQKKKDSLLKSKFTFSTVASTSNYTFSNRDYLSEMKLWVVSADPTIGNYPLNYLSEQEALLQYVDFDTLTFEGKPSEFWLETTSTAGQIQLRINPIPDAIYTIKGYKYEPFARVEAIDVTSCTYLGDQLIQSYIAHKISNELQKGNMQDLENIYYERRSQYLCENTHENDINTLMTPYQEV